MIFKIKKNIQIDFYVLLLHHVFFKVGSDTTCRELEYKNNIAQRKIKFSNLGMSFIKNKRRTMLFLK
jgi:hypothetical protein